MREIKFRGKRVDNGELVYGDLLHCYGADTGRIFIKTFTGLYEVDPATVGEYTGMKDKNGTDVWEGDIVEWENLMKTNMRSVIAYRDRMFCFVDANNEPEEIWCCSFTKIGNIHDTPNYDSWLRGCPRMDEEQIARLEELQRDVRSAEMNLKVEIDRINNLKQE